MKVIMIEIQKNIEIIDLALFLKPSKTLILADLHIGYEECLHSQGILIPQFQFQDTVKRLEKILKAARPETIIINGDLKHEFGKISETEWRHTLQILDILALHTKKILLVRGNHDTILEPIAEKRKVEVTDHVKIDDIYITHGDLIPKNNDYKNCKTIIIGHEHPAVTLKEDLREEKFKCFLRGSYKNKHLIVQPSFNLVTEGTDILEDDLLSPFLHQDLAKFHVYIVSGGVYDFGLVKNLLW